MKIINGLIVISEPLEVSERMGLIGPGKCRRINGISYLSLPDYRRLFKLPQQIHPMQAMHHLPEQICVNDRQIEEGVHEARAVDARVKSLIDFRNKAFTDFKIQRRIRSFIVPFYVGLYWEKLNSSNLNPEIYCFHHQSENFANM